MAGKTSSQIPCYIPRAERVDLLCPGPSLCQEKINRTKDNKLRIQKLLIINFEIPQILRYTLSSEEQ